MLLEFGKLRGSYPLLVRGEVGESRSKSGVAGRGTMPTRAPTPTRLTAESSADATPPMFQVTANKQLSIVEMARVAPLPLPPPVSIDLSSDKERLESAGARDIDADRTLSIGIRKTSRILTSPCPRRGRRKPLEERCRRERDNAYSAPTPTRLTAESSAEA